MIFSEAAPRGVVSRIRLEHWAPGSYLYVPADGPVGRAYDAGSVEGSPVVLAHVVFTSKAGAWLPYSGPLAPGDPDCNSGLTIGPT